jgi:hypothetical protein
MKLADAAITLRATLARLPTTNHPLLSRCALPELLERIASERRCGVVRDELTSALLEEFQASSGESRIAWGAAMVVAHLPMLVSLETRLSWRHPRKDLAKRVTSSFLSVCAHIETAQTSISARLEVLTESSTRKSLRS